MTGASAAGRRWWPARRRVAALALLTATLTGAAATALSGGGGRVYGALAYVAVATAALFSPAAITLQVIAGQVLAGSVLLGRDGPAPLLLVPFVAGVVATAELLGVAARLDGPLERDPAPDLRRAGRAAALGGGVFGVVALAGGLPGPTGLAALGLAAGGYVAVAFLLARGAP